MFRRALVATLIGFNTAVAAPYEVCKKEDSTAAPNVTLRCQGMQSLSLYGVKRSGAHYKFRLKPNVVRLSVRFNADARGCIALYIDDGISEEKWLVRATERALRAEKESQTNDLFIVSSLQIDRRDGLYRYRSKVDRVDRKAVNTNDSKIMAQCSAMTTVKTDCKFQDGGIYKCVAF